MRRRSTETVQEAVDAASLWRRTMDSRIFLNEKSIAEQDKSSKVKVRVPLRKPGFLVPPFSWFIKPRDSKVIQLDPLGSEIFNLIRNCENVGEVVDAFAENHGLSFHESRVSVTQYISQLVENGVVVVALPEEKDAET